MTRPKKILIFMIIACFFAIPPALIINYQNHKQKKPLHVSGQFLFSIYDTIGKGQLKSQTLAFVMLENSSKALNAIIIPEDTKVEIANAGFNRLKHAYGFKDFSLTSKSGSRFIGIRKPSETYITMSTTQFAKFVDKLGGIKVRQHGTLAKGSEVIWFLEQAQRYDEPRTVSSIVSGMFERMAFTKQPLPLSVVKTNLDTESFTTLMSRITDADNVSVGYVPGSPSIKNGVSYWIPNEAILSELRRQNSASKFSDAVKVIARQAEIDSKPVVAAAKTTVVAAKKIEKPLRSQSDYRVEIYNASGKSQASSKTKKLLIKSDYRVKGVSNYKGSNYYSSVVLYAPGWEREATRIAALLDWKILKCITDKKQFNTNSHIILVIGEDVNDTNVGAIR